jgi:hypothetical protein
VERLPGLGCRAEGQRGDGRIICNSPAFSGKRQGMRLSRCRPRLSSLGLYCQNNGPGLAWPLTPSFMVSVRYPHWSFVSVSIPAHRWKSGIPKQRGRRMSIAQYTGRKSLEAIAASAEGGLPKTLGPYNNGAAPRPAGGCGRPPRSITGSRCSGCGASTATRSGHHCSASGAYGTSRSSIATCIWGNAPRKHGPAAWLRTGFVVTAM